VYLSKARMLRVDGVSSSPDNDQGHRNGESFKLNKAVQSGCLVLPVQLLGDMFCQSQYTLPLLSAR
jgi:hypothetical protein